MLKEFSAAQLLDQQLDRVKSNPCLGYEKTRPPYMGTRYCYEPFHPDMALVMLKYFKIRQQQQSSTSKPQSGDSSPDSLT